MGRALVLAILLAGAGKVSACEKPWFGINTISHHFSSKNYNENNYGLFYECPGTWGYQAGYYKNSFYQHTLYYVGTYSPIHIGPVDLGVFGGPATGYNNSVVLIGGIVGSVRLTDHFAIQAIANHAVIGLQLKAEF